MVLFKCKIETNKTKETKNVQSSMVRVKDKEAKAGIVRGSENTVSPMPLQGILTGGSIDCTGTSEQDDWVLTDSTWALLCPLICYSRKYFKSTDLCWMPSAI